MKKTLLLFFTGMIALCPKIKAQEHKEHFNKEFTPSKDASSTVLSIYNVDGPIKVEGYAGSTITMEIDESISGDDKEAVEIGKKEFKLDFQQTADTIMAYISAPFDSRPHHNWNRNDNGRDIEYHYSLVFIVKVPYGTNLDISTVNNGDIAVNNVTGSLRVNNVNGAIAITGAKGATHAHTINGAVGVSYASVPTGPSSYYTINGEIKATYPADLSADMQFKSMNGEFFTDFPTVEVLPAKVIKNQETKNGATVYKLNKITEVRIGSGSNNLKFETLNGNIYIKKQS